MNPENLIPNSERSPNEVRENSRKGGINSGRTRRRKRTVKKILSEFLLMDVSENDRLSKLAERYGVDSDGINVEDLFVALCTINTMQNGTLGDLAALIGLLGEDTVEKKAESSEYDALTLSLIEEARRLENADKP